MTLFMVNLLIENEVKSLKEIFFSLFSTKKSRKTTLKPLAVFQFNISIVI